MALQMNLRNNALDGIRGKHASYFLLERPSLDPTKFWRRFDMVKGVFIEGHGPGPVLTLTY